jgi:hypothetical protein
MRHVVGESGIILSVLSGFGADVMTNPARKTVGAFCGDLGCWLLAHRELDHDREPARPEWSQRQLSLAKVLRRAQSQFRYRRSGECRIRQPAAYSLVCLRRKQAVAFFAGFWTRWKMFAKVREDETTNDLFAFFTTEPNAIGRADPRQGHARHSGDARGNRCLDVGTRIGHRNLTALAPRAGDRAQRFCRGVRAMRGAKRQRAA